MKFLKGFVYAYRGLSYAYSGQLNFKVHTLATVAVLLCGYFFKISIVEWLWITAAIALVIITELLNTAIETLVDLVSPEFHPKAGTVKDLTAAAVLIAALTAVLIGLLIFLPKLGLTYAS